MKNNDLLQPRLYRVAKKGENETVWRYFRVQSSMISLSVDEDENSVGMLTFVKDGAEKDIYTGDILYQYCEVTDTIKFFEVVYEQGTVYAKTKIRVISDKKIRIRDVKLTLKGMHNKSLFIAGDDVNGISDNYLDEYEEYINYLVEGITF